MEYREMSWLSPVSWAKWTWTAVRGGEGEEDEEGLEASEEREQCVKRDREEEEERSQECRQVSFEPGDSRQGDLRCHCHFYM